VPLGVQDRTRGEAAEAREPGEAGHEDREAGVSGAIVRVARESDLEAFVGLRAQSYALAPDAAQSWPTRLLDAGLVERILVAEVDGVVAGALVVLPFGQFWGGRPVPTGGISSVVVAPEHRGRGVATGLLVAARRMMRERGEALSVLAPATMPVYRNAGWEQAGDQRAAAVPIADLARLGAPSPDVRERPATAADHDAIKRVYLRTASRRTGMLARPAVLWSAYLHTEPLRRVYVAEREGAVVGHVAYRQERRARGGYTLRVEDLAALDWDAEATIWRHLAAHRAQAEDAVVHAPTDHLALHLAEQRIRSVWSQHWMLRVVDARAAIAQRGFPHSLTVSLPLTLVDDGVADHVGAHVLDVADGHGELRGAGGSDPGGPVLGPNAFAALYSGFASPATLVGAGLLTGGSAEQLDDLGAAFAGPRAFFNDDF
jgi:predicted acetyltransferase